MSLYGIIWSKKIYLADTNLFGSEVQLYFWELGVVVHNYCLAKALYSFRPQLLHVEFPWCKHREEVHLGTIYLGLTSLFKLHLPECSLTRWCSFCRLKMMSLLLFSILKTIKVCYLIPIIILQCLLENNEAQIFQIHKDLLSLETQVG